MNTNTDAEARRKRIINVVQIAGLCIAGALFAPFALMTIKGVVSLLVVATIGLATVNIGIPWFGVKMAVWRLKALKSVASQNPIETLENQYAQKCEALQKSRDNIKETYAVVQDLWNQIQDHNQRFPNKPSQFLEKYEKLKDLVALRGVKYKQAQQNLATFSDLIEEKRSDWKIAQSMAKADKLANVGEDFTTKLMQDTALTTVQDGLNFAFSELEVSLLDEQSSNERKSAPALIPAAKPLAIAEKNGPPVMDLDFNTSEQAYVPATKKRKK